MDNQILDDDESIPVQFTAIVLDGAWRSKSA
jgi:hypothetical protein